MIDSSTKVDSAEGIAAFISWARAHRVVLSPTHRQIARKYGVSVDGVLFKQVIPLTAHPNHPIMRLK